MPQAATVHQKAHRATLPEQELQLLRACWQVQHNIALPDDISYFLSGAVILD